MSEATRTPMGISGYLITTSGKEPKAMTDQPRDATRQPTFTERKVLELIALKQDYVADTIHPRAFTACWAAGWIAANPQNEEYPDAVILTDTGRRALDA